MENPTHSLRETNLCFSSYKNLKLKGNYDELKLAKEKRGYFWYCLCFISMYSVLNALSEYTYFYIQKTQLNTLFCLLLKTAKAFSVFLMKRIYTNARYQLRLSLLAMNPL